MKMSVYNKRWPKYSSWIGITFVIAAIIGLHAVWLHYFATTKHGEIKNGQLDLQQWDEQSGQALTLDGAWLFYPNSFIISNSSVHTAEQQHNPTTCKQYSF